LSFWSSGGGAGIRISCRGETGWVGGGVERQALVMNPEPGFFVNGWCWSQQQSATPRVLEVWEKWKFGGFHLSRQEATEYVETLRRQRSLRTDSFIRIRWRQLAGRCAVARSRFPFLLLCPAHSILKFCRFGC